MAVDERYAEPPGVTVASIFENLRPDVALDRWMLGWRLRPEIRQRLEAGVGRSTFYDHYSSAHDIHQQALAGPLTLLAEAILGVQTEERLSFLLTHFWENRARARSTLYGEQGEKVAQLLILILGKRPRTSTLGNFADLTMLISVYFATEDRHEQEVSYAGGLARHH